MSEQHPLHVLRSELEALRERAVDKLAASEAPLTTNALQELAFVQAALGAVFGKKWRAMGWGKEEMRQNSLRWMLGIRIYTLGGDL